MSDQIDTDFQERLLAAERKIFRLAVLEHVIRNVSDDETRRVVCPCCEFANAIYRWDGKVWRCQMLVLDEEGRPTSCYHGWSGSTAPSAPALAQPPYIWPVDIYYTYSRYWQEIELAALKKARAKNDE